jgi:hypothetical protein
MTNTDRCKRAKCTCCMSTNQRTSAMSGAASSACCITYALISASSMPARGSAIVVEPNIISYCTQTLVSPDVSPSACLMAEAGADGSK